MYKNALIDVLTNLDLDFVPNQKPEYNRGILVGLVSALMLRMPFETAIKKIKEAMPEKYDLASIPEPWREYFAH